MLHHLLLAVLVDLRNHLDGNLDVACLLYTSLCTGGWYTQRALGQQLRDTVVPADRGKIYSADGALLIYFKRSIMKITH